MIDSKIACLCNHCHLVGKKERSLRGLLSGHRRLSPRVSDATSQPLLPLSFLPEVEMSVKFQTFEEMPLS